MIPRLLPLILIPLLTSGLSLGDEVDAAARAALARGDVDGAREALAHLGDEAHRRLGDLLRESGRPEDALPHFRRALRRAPGDPGVSLGYGRALLDLGRYGAAIPLLQTAAAAGAPEAIWALGIAQVRGGSLPDGLARLREARASRVDPYASSAAELYDYFLDRHMAELDAAREAGRRALDHGRWPEAARLLLGYGLAVGEAPGDCLDGARAALTAGLDPALAVRGFRQVLEHGSTAQRAGAHTGLGAAHLRLGDPAAARDQFTEAVALDPASPEAHFGLALALARAGVFAEAAEHLETALARASPEKREDLLRVARSERTFAGRRADPRLRDLVRGR